MHTLPSSPATWWFLRYHSLLFRGDLVAGLTTAAVVIPKAMAYASIVGLPLEVGLYTALVPMVIYAVLGTSPSLSVSTTSTIAILTAAQLASVAPGGSPAQLMTTVTTLALVVGVMLVLASVCRLGFLANFISDPVLTGFKSGIGLVIVVDQLPKLLGLHIAKGPLLHNLAQIATHVPETSVPTLILGVGTLGLIFWLEHSVPRLPAPLLAAGAGIVLSGVLGLSAMGIDTVGAFSTGLPGLVWPDLTLVAALWPGALGIALMSFTETIASGRAFARPGEPRPQADRELLALGIANTVGAHFMILPAGGGTSQTAVNHTAGARTQMAELVTAAAVALTLLFLAPLIRLLPQATLAAIIVATSVVMIKPAEFRDIRRLRTLEFYWAVIAVIGVVWLGVLQGILVAVCVSLLWLIYQANHPPVYILGRKPGTDIFRPLAAEHAEDETFPGLLILRTEGRVQFANAQRIGDKMWPLIHEYQPGVLLLDFSAVPDIEYTALRMLIDAEQKLREAGITLWLAALNPGVLEMIRKSSLAATLGNERMFFSVATAVEAYRTSLKG